MIKIILVAIVVAGSLVMSSCSWSDINGTPPTPTPTTESRLVAKGTSLNQAGTLVVICDTETGNLVYFSDHQIYVMEKAGCK